MGESSQSDLKLGEYSEENIQNQVIVIQDIQNLLADHRNRYLFQWCEKPAIAAGGETMKEIRTDPIVNMSLPAVRFVRKRVTRSDRGLSNIENPPLNL